MRDRLIAGTTIPAAWVHRAQRFRSWYRERVLALFDDVDVILAPCTPCRALRIGQATMELDGVTVPARPNIGVFTQPISFIGLPVVAVPVRVGGGLPLAVQVIAAPWREDLALRVAGAIEGAAAARRWRGEAACLATAPTPRTTPTSRSRARPPLPCGRGVGGEGDTALFKH